MHDECTRQVAQLYLSRPLLWRRRKFDLRVVALMLSSDPLELYVHDTYWPRVAERPHETAATTTTERRDGGAAAAQQLPPSLLEDPRVSRTATHLLRGGG